MYDKDDFPLDIFDNTQFEAETGKDKKMAVACIKQPHLPVDP